jgi:hypothetical protein
VAKTLGQRKFQVAFDLSEARRQVIANDRFNAPSFQRRGKAANAAAENGDAHASYVVSRTPPRTPCPCRALDGNRWDVDLGRGVGSSRSSTACHGQAIQADG